MQTNQFRLGLSLLELLAAVTIVAVVAVLVLPRFGVTSQAARQRACEVHCGNLEIQTRLWHRTKGVWPANDLSDLGGNTSFLPEGVPTCPVDGSAYTLDPTSHEISGHTH